MIGFDEARQLLDSGEATKLVMIGTPESLVDQLEGAMDQANDSELEVELESDINGQIIVSLSEPSVEGEEEDSDDAE